MTTAIADEFQSHRPRLFGLAYRMLGSADEAEDTVQDAYLRFSGADRADIEHLGAWLAKVVTNLCLNRLTSARARREQYVGTWLPEPVVTSDGTLGPLESAEQRDAVSMALLVLLERLTPTERAVYVLREAFAYGYREIAGVLDLSEANCRQLHRRAAQRVGAAESRFAAPPERQRELVASFVTAARDGDLSGLEKLLAADATWWSDGGGRVSAARRPVEGREKVLRFLFGALEKWGAGMRFAPAEVNGGPGLTVWDGDTLTVVITFDVSDVSDAGIGGVIGGVRAVLNPEKLEFAGRQLADR
ncbi:RNA polymerase sigma-70 factor [Streptomyces sp. SID13726]|uniref:RNA polymerase sigma-70 factor n=1 Tax=Streptomyces sp. SID13726 TaxID=2706058 RepID=UPI0013B6B95D|nr:RNA polymerase sigma-70 factor [Streptomyces sp. SID13726]NEB05893.1 RNA polymerase sigma-70 factor [Streptomyces sp. SID13726]